MVDACKSWLPGRTGQTSVVPRINIYWMRTGLFYIKRLWIGNTHRIHCVEQQAEDGMLCFMRNLLKNLVLILRLPIALIKAIEQ